LNTPLIEFKHIDKTFGHVRANVDVSFAVQPGSIHGIVGENGAGKSTIMKVLYGLYPPDRGEIFFQGKSVEIRTPQEAIHLGIGMVHQHFMLVPTLTVWENVILGVEPTLGRLPKEDILKQLESLQKEFGFALPLEGVVENLSVGQQQQIEILKLLYHNAETLILDEPTAVLTPPEVETLFVHLRNLWKSGKTIILITHKLKEILGFTERVTIMRQGSVVETIEVGQLTESTLAEKIIGRKQKTLPYPPPVAERKTALAVKNLSVWVHRQRNISDVSFSVSEGEILGIAGVEGNGQGELVEALSALTSYDGEISLFDCPLPQSNYELRQNGFSLIPPDRQHQGLILNFSVQENFLLGQHREKRFLKFPGVYSSSGCEQYAERLITQYDVRPANRETAISTLSGGNQQKVIIAHELEKNPKFLLAVHPTRGVDIGAIEFIHSQFLELRKKGTAILLISSELDEVIALSDRILVLNRGKIAGSAMRGEATEKQLGLWMTEGA
jgi:general nucleoside transport system ATP-binding protein